MERAFELARGADMGQLFDHIDTMADFDANYRAPDSKQTLLHLVSPAAMRSDIEQTSPLAERTIDASATGGTCGAMACG